MRVLGEDGIEAGETGAAALAGLLEVLSGGYADTVPGLSVGPDARVLLLCTEGATDPESYRRLMGFPRPPRGQDSHSP